LNEPWRLRVSSNEVTGETKGGEVMSNELLVVRGNELAGASKQRPYEVKDDRDILEILKAELNFLEKGGYGRSVRTPWVPTSAFQDSPSCVCFPYHDHKDECALMQFVPPDRRLEAVPCHHIPLNEAGETVDLIERTGSQEESEGLVMNWLRESIAEIERERAKARQ
jgi:hypothetical protein